MAQQKVNLTTLGQIQSDLQSAYLSAPKIAVPNGTVIDPMGSVRQIYDPSKTLRPAIGVERILFREMQETDETSSSSNLENVFKLPNEDRVRFVGNWLQDSQNTVGSGAVSSTSTSDYFEVTFYGTGLNIITLVTNDARDWRASVDGGVAGANLFISGSTVIDSQGFESNNIRKVVSGLALGTHTIKIANFAAIGVRFYGVEILNESSSITIPKGEIIANGKKHTLGSQTTTPYNSGFDGSPVLNGRGGKVAIYLKDGVVGKAIQQTNAITQFFTGSVDHSNEEVIRKINWLDFGSGDVGDDFSTKTTSETDSWFTMNDGSLTLFGNNTTKSVVGYIADLQQNFSNSGFVNLTFIGTGLDVWVIPRSATPTTFTVQVDGVSIGTMTTLTGMLNKKVLQRVVSGLPYGTHTVTLTKSASGTDTGLLDFVIYGPKEPEIPEGAVKISDYYLMANYSATVLNNSLAKSQGVVNKTNQREMIYSGTWDVATVNADAPYYVTVSTATVSAYVEYVFWGTAVDINVRDSGVAASATVQIDGALYTGAATVVGGGSWTPGTGTWAGTATGNGSKVQISGLTLGLHTVRLTRATGTIRFNGFDYATPVHYPDLLRGSLSINPTFSNFLNKDDAGLLDLGKAKAWVRFDNSAQSIQHSYNIAAVQRLTTGQMMIFFKTPFKNANYTWANSGPQMFPSAIGAPGSLTFNNVSPGHCVLTHLSGGGTATNFEVACVVFFGELVGEGE